MSIKLDINRFSAETLGLPVLLEVDMPRGYKKDGSFAGKVYQKGHPFYGNLDKPNYFKKGHKPYYWKGGKYKNNGYIFILKPEHPFCNAIGYVREHRLVVEKYLKRYLKPKERVHHINEIKDDNRIENLMLFKNQTYHSWFHCKGFCNPKGIIFDGRQ